MQTIIDEVIVKEGHRVLVTSDIHGRPDYLKALLEKAKFTREDALFIVGDILQRGIDNMEVLRYVMELCRTTATYMVIGNNDEMVIQLIDDESEEADQAIVDWVEAYIDWGIHDFFQDAMAELGFTDLRKETVPQLRALLKERYSAELRFLRGLPTILDAGSYVFVHAGMPHMDKEKLSQMDILDLVKWDAFYKSDVTLETPTFVGHWPVSNYISDHLDVSPIMDYERGILSIDGGNCIKDCGQLNMVALPDLRSRDYEVIYYDPHPEAVVLEDQPEKKGTVFITWLNRQVEMVEDLGYWKKVRHRDTGTIVTVAESYLFTHKNELCLRDYSDYEIGVSEGDRVQVEQELVDDMYLIKKNGNIGWYHGKLQK